MKSNNRTQVKKNRSINCTQGKKEIEIEEVDKSTDLGNKQEGASIKG